MVLLAASAATSGTTPIVPTPRTGFARQEWIAAAIVVGVISLIVLLRRFRSARQAGLAMGTSALYAVGHPAPAGGQQPQLRGLLVGSDNRFSTSKTASAIWFGILLYFITAMALIIGYQRDKFSALIGEISPLYLVLLGGPFAAAVLAKVTVSSNVNSQQQQKSDAVTPRISDVFSDDDGNTDLVDTQYLSFNILAAGIVLVQFVHAPGLGAPNIPDFLAGLTSASAATYVANKSLVSGNKPTVSGLSPGTVRAGGEVAVRGANFLAQGDSQPPSVFINSGAAIPATDKPPRADLATFRVPRATPISTVSITVVTPSLLKTDPMNLAVIGDSVSVSAARPIEVQAGASLVVEGAGFYDPADVDSTGTAVEGAQPPATVALRSQVVGGPTRRCSLLSGTDTRLEVTVPADVLGGGGAQWFDLVVSRPGAPIHQSSIGIHVNP